MKEITLEILQFVITESLAFWWIIIKNEGDLKNQINPVTGKMVAKLLMIW